MDQIEPLESLNRRIHTISTTEIMPFNLYMDIARYALGGTTNGQKMSSLQSLRNSVISRSSDIFVDMATFALQQHQLQFIKPKPKPMDTSRLNSLAIIAAVIAFTCVTCIMLLRIERLEQKVERMQQKIGYYESETP